MSRVAVAGDRYELTIDDRRAGLLSFRDDGDVVDLVHTEIDPELRGGELGSELVAGALDDLRARGRSVRPSCSFVAAYIRRHPEYADLVAD
jgi:uncharacterized protein